MIEELSKPILVQLELSFFYNYIFSSKMLHVMFSDFLLACNFTKSKTSPCVFFKFLKLCKWCHISQNIAYKLARIWLSCKYFANCLVLVCVRNYLSFVLNHKRHYLQNHDAFHLSDIQLENSFFPSYIYL